jgi:hypothetical protein
MTLPAIFGKRERRLANSYHGGHAVRQAGHLLAKGSASATLSIWSSARPLRTSTITARLSPVVVGTDRRAQVRLQVAMRITTCLTRGDYASAMTDPLSALAVVPKTGAEHFHASGEARNENVLGFWR